MTSNNHQIIYNEICRKYLSEEEEPIKVTFAKVLNLFVKNGTLTAGQILTEVRKNVSQFNVLQAFNTIIFLGWEWNAFFSEERISGDCLEWENVAFRCSVNERFSMPKIIRYLLRLLITEGYLDCRDALVWYFDDIGDKFASYVPRIFEYAIKNSVFGLISANAIVKGCELSGLPRSYAGTLILELKGAGAISPYVSGTNIVRRLFLKMYDENLASGPFYKVNRALLIWGNCYHPKKIIG
ncbi:MAG: hypothetical protein ACTSXJ_05275 [Candidatus Baldrarchaeia archaeon]